MESFLCLIPPRMKGKVASGIINSVDGESKPSKLSSEDRFLSSEFSRLPKKAYEILDCLKRYLKVRHYFLLGNK